MSGKRPESVCEWLIFRMGNRNGVSELFRWCGVLVGCCGCVVGKCDRQKKSPHGLRGWLKIGERIEMKAEKMSKRGNVMKKHLNPWRLSRSHKYINTAGKHLHVSRWWR